MWRAKWTLGTMGRSYLPWLLLCCGKCRAYRCSLALVAMATFVILLHLWMPSERGLVHSLDMSSLRKCMPSPESSPIHQVEDTCVYVYSVFGHNSRPRRGWYNVVINAWDGGASDSQFRCCFPQSDGSMESVQAEVVNRFYDKPAPFRAVQFNCPVSLGGNSPPSTVFLTPKSCSEPGLHSHKILRAKSQPKEVGICAKVAYGHLVPRQVAEWFDIQISSRVSKILLYTYQLDSATDKVLSHYAKRGYLEVLPFDIPQIVLSKPDRGFEPQRRYLPQFLHDEQVAVFDCQERLAGMSYVMQLDLDELLQLPPGTSLPEFFEKELFGNYLRYPMAATFTFSVKFYITDWMQQTSNSSLKFTHYYERTAPRYECIKTVHRPDRIRVFYTHEAFTRAWYYFMYNVDAEISTVLHYRECPEKWTDCLTMPRFAEYPSFFSRSIVLGRLQRLPQDVKDSFT